MSVAGGAGTVTALLLRCDGLTDAGVLRALVEDHSVDDNGNALLSGRAFLLQRRAHLCSKGKRVRPSCRLR